MTMATLSRIRRAPTQPAPAPDPQLVSALERLRERIALLQSELGGLFYEMAIRDHIRLDVLMSRAAVLQRLDEELRRVERELGGAAEQ
jgi:hypothetical protein